MKRLTPSIKSNITVINKIEKKMMIGSARRGPIYFNVTFLKQDRLFLSEPGSTKRCKNGNKNPNDEAKR